MGWGGCGGGAGGGRPHLVFIVHVRRELQVLTAKISGPDGKEKKKGEDVRRTDLLQSGG